MSDNLIFISYRSTDSAKVDTIVSRLRSIQANGKPKYSVWQDKTHIQPADDWWLSIVNAIRACKVFVFMVSAESVMNVNCRAELAFARKLNKHIVPVALNGEFFYNRTSAKNDITYWDDVPEELNDIRAQFLFDDAGSQTIDELDATFERCIAKPKDAIYRYVDTPPDPRHVNDATNSTTAIYEEAYELAWKLDFNTAERRFRRLIDLQDRHFEAEAREWLLILEDYRQLIVFDSRKATQYKVKRAWQEYTKAHSGKEFLPDTNGLFDPKGFSTRNWDEEKKDQHDPYDRDRVVAKITPTRKTALDLLPKPFAWIPIPEGKVTLITEKGWSKNYIPEGQSQTFPVPAFDMAKYPCTNAQFKLFIDAGGYDEKHWWTEDGWAQRQKDKWTQPRYWGDSKWNGADYPVVGVSWYEAVAFCTWLSQTTGENIMLPTEQQWQRAAQGDKGLMYPWGNDWDASRCNNAVEKGIGKTTPVTYYEGKGDSPFGVTDMVGNVWEWCLTAYETGNTDLQGTDVRVLRGGSWNNFNPYGFRAVFRLRSPLNGYYNWGFRIVCSR